MKKATLHLHILHVLSNSHTTNYLIEVFWSQPDLVRGKVHGLGKLGSVIWQVRFLGDEDDTSSEAFLPQSFGTAGPSTT